MENTELLPSKRLPNTHLFALGTLALAVLILPLAVVAAQLTTNLSSKAYIPTTDTGITSLPPQTRCVGTVEDISYGSSCTLTTPTPQRSTISIRKMETRTDSTTVSTRQGSEPEIVGNQNVLPTLGYTGATVNCTGGYSEKIGINRPVTTGGTDVTKKVGAVRTLESDQAVPATQFKTTCIPTKEISAMATAICSQHPVCPTPTPIQACKTRVKQYAFDLPCIGTARGTEPEAKPLQTGTTKEANDISPKNTERDLVQPTYTYINFTCADGFIERYTNDTCSSTQALLKSAEDICKDHLAVKPTYGAKCTVPVGLYQGGKNTQVDSKFPTQGQIGHVSIKFSCPDGFESDYKPTSCSTQGSLNAYAHKFCLSHLVPCPSPTPNTPTVKLTPTVTRPTVTPFPTSTRPIPTTSLRNTPPTVTTTSINSGVAGRTYIATITAKDQNPGDNLYMTISGLPFGIYQGQCRESSTTTPNGIVAPGSYISCNISGTPIRSGSYTLTANVQDDKGLSSSKSLTLTITSETER